MNRFKVIAYPLCILVWILTNIVFIKFSKEADVDLLEKKLDIAVNYAVDAAVDEMVESSYDLDMDYTKWEYANVDPQIAYDTFVTIFMRNWNLGDSKYATANKAMVETEWLPCFIVAAYDGYYIFEPTLVTNSDGNTHYEPRCSIKYPYAYYDADHNTSYAFNLSHEDAITYKAGLVSKIKASMFSVEDQKYLISAAVSDSIQTTVQKQLGGNSKTTIYIPMEVTKFSRTNPISGITCLAYMSGVSDGINRTDDVLGIGGARINHENFVVCYKRDGVPLYCYSKDKPNDVIVEQVYENAITAASKGYYYDYSIVEK